MRALARLQAVSFFFYFLWLKVLLRSKNIFIFSSDFETLVTKQSPCEILGLNFEKTVYSREDERIAARIIMPAVICINYKSVRALSSLSKNGDSSVFFGRKLLVRYCWELGNVKNRNKLIELKSVR